MQKLQDSVFSIVKTTNLSPAVFSFLQPTEDFTDKTPLGGILKDTKHGWLALGPKFCVVDLRTGLKVAARNFSTPQSNINTLVTSVVELPRPLSANSIQLIISLQSDEAGMICVLHVNGSQLLHCIQTEVVVTELAVWDRVPDGPISCFDGVVMAGTKSGEIFAFDLNRASLLQALKDISQGNEHLVQNEANPANLSFLQSSAIHRILEQRELALENDDHLAILLNENSLVDGQYIFRNPDGTVRMKAKRDHIRVTVLQYIPQLGSLAVGYNFGAFQIWNIMTLELEFTSQVNVECLPVTHFGFQEPCDDPRAFCYLWVVFSVTDRFEEEEFPLAVMYSLTYQGKRMLSDTKCLYQEFSTATVRFQLELSTVDEASLLGGKCVSCHAYSVNSTLAAEGEESMLNICQIVWECWGENARSSTQYGMLLFDLDQWYKDQMPATWPLQSNAFMSVTWCCELSAGDCVTLDVRLDPASVAVYSHATRLEEHFYPNSLQYNCICLNTSEACVLSTIGIQRQIIGSIDEVGPTALLNPPRLYNACMTAGLTPLYVHTYGSNISPEEQRRYLLSVALEARLSRFLKRCAHDWATGSHSGAGCTLTFIVDWCWKRAIELKENAKELTAPLFTSSALPDRNVVRCLEHCVQQLTQLTGLLDAVLTKCCNLIIPDALSEIEEKYKGIGTVSLYFQVVQWFLRVGLLPERHDGYNALPYPAQQLYSIYNKRRLKLNRLQDNVPTEETAANKPCSLLYIDQLIEQEFGGERTHQMWIKGGSECNGLYPPPSLYSLLRLYLLPDIAEEHKHSLVLYLLVDYSMVYDEVRYEAVIRRLMQFPTMFGLSNTAIKATQAFWHLDHRDFDFALDQLQCLTGNTLSDWQHNVVLSTLLAQKKTQAALQYLHVRKPAPIQNIRDRDGDMTSCSIRVNDHDKLEDWQSCCNLYLARGLVFEALDVIRMCVLNAGSVDDKVTVLQFFFKGCRNTGNLAKILQVTMTPLEEEMFVKYLKDCNEPHTSDILVMYYLQQSRYLEAERYNNQLKQQKPRAKDVSTSVESLFDMMDRDSARDAIVDVVCASLPAITNTVAHYALDSRDVEPHVIAAKPLSVYVKAKSPKNTFTYKSSFIQDTIENASETWINRPKMRRGIKRALNVEDTPFICTPKLTRTRSILSSEQKPSESTPPKRARLDLTGTPKTPKMGNSFHVSEKLSSQMSILLDMPDVQSPDCKLYTERPGTPHSILKTRRNSDVEREAPSPVDSRYLGDSDDELMDTASNHTHYSDANKHLRFTIPTASESGSTPSPQTVDPPQAMRAKEMERCASAAQEKELDVSVDSFVTTTSHAMTETNPMESPSKKLATEESIKSRKSFKDTVRARRSFSISINSSLSDDPNSSIESIADIPVTLINPRYSGEKRHKLPSETSEHQLATEQRDLEHSVRETEIAEERRELPKTPKGRRGIRAATESTPLFNRSRNTTPERLDSPITTPLPSSRITRSRSRSRTPELSPRASPLAPIPEQPKQETDSEPHPQRTTLSVPRQLRSRSRTPERKDKGVAESPKLEAISESPTKSYRESSSSSSTTSGPSLRSRSRTSVVKDTRVVESPKLQAVSESPTKSYRDAQSSSSSSTTSGHSSRSNSRTPDTEVVQELILKQTPPRSLRSRSKTPEQLMSPRVESSARAKKSLSRKAFENILMAKARQADQMEAEAEEQPETAIACTPMKAFKQVPSLMDVTFSPIVNKSVLQSSTDTTISSAEKAPKSDKSTLELDLNPLPAFTTLHETCIEKSVLHSYESSVAETSVSIREEKVVFIEKSETNVLKPLPAFTLNESEFDKSVLHSYESSVAEESSIQEDRDSTQTDKNVSKPLAAFVQMIQSDYDKSVLHSAQSSINEASQLKDDSRVPEEPSSLMTNDSDEESEENEDEDDEEGEDEEDEEIEEEGDEDIEEVEDVDEHSEEDVKKVNEKSEAEKKEKEKIGEIVRDIDAIEGMSEEEQDTSDSQESVVTSLTESRSSEEEDDDQVISVEDSDSSRDNLQIDEQPKAGRSDDEFIDVVEIEEEPSETRDNIDSINVTHVASSNDPLNQANFSLMTDDNSVEESDKSDLNLNYSGDSDKVNVSGETPVEKIESVPEPAVQLEIPAPVDNQTKERSPPTSEVDAPEYKTTTCEDKDIEIIESGKEEVPEVKNIVPEVTVEVSKVSEEEAMNIEEAPKFTEKEITESVPVTAEEVPKIIEDAPIVTENILVSTEKVSAVVEDVPMVTEKILKVKETVTEVSQEAPQIRKEVTAAIEKMEETTEQETEKPTRSRKRGKSETVTEVSQEAPQDTKEVTVSTKKMEVITEQKAEKPTGSRKRGNSETVTEVSEEAPVITKELSAAIEKMEETTKQEVEKPTRSRKRGKSETDTELSQEAPVVTKEVTVEMEVITEQEVEKPKRGKSETVTEVSQEAPQVTKEVTAAIEKMEETTKQETEKPTRSRKRGKSETVTEVSQEAPQDTKEVTAAIEKMEETAEQETEKLTRSRKRGKSETVTEVSQEAPQVTKEVTAAIEKMEETTEQETEKPTRSTKRGKSKTVTEVSQEAPQATKEVTVATEKMEETTEQEVEKPTRSRKRGKSETVTEVSQEAPQDTKEVTAAIEKMEETTEQETEKPTRSTKRGKSKTVTEVSQDASQVTKDVTVATEKMEETTEQEVEKPTRSRKRVKSTSSNKSTTEPEMEPESKMPATRKRTQSNASNISMEIEQKTPEKAESTTPSRRRAKTPTSAEVRKIITRRISREMSGKLDQSNVLDETATTPKRRSTRTRSKNVDDNESVASESSFVSGRSKASDDAGDRAVKKGRKSTLVSKPELSVIPEVTAEEGSKLNADNVISEYSSARRLTRHQKAVLESWLEPAPSPRRRTSTASRTSITSRSVASEADDDDASSTHSAAFDVQPIDRISLLNKTDFDGIPDIDELQMNLSPESLASDASKQRRLRLGRAASETKTIPRAAKISRRVSVDVVNSPDLGSPILVGTDSPARGRRKSFNRACEALHTPKGRRTSTEVRKGEGESPMVSPGPSEGEAPEPATPARRTRRAASTMSNTSQTASETGKRTRKTTVDEAKETKKK